MQHFLALHPIALYGLSVFSVLFAGAFIGGAVVMWRNDTRERARRLEPLRGPISHARHRAF